MFTALLATATLLTITLLISLAFPTKHEPGKVTVKEYQLANRDWLKKLDRSYNRGIITREERNNRVKCDLRGRKLVKA